MRLCFQTQSSRRTKRWSERSAEAGEPTGARGSRRLSVVRAVHEPTRSESEGEHVCGPGVILTASVKGAREMHLRRSRQVPRRAQRGALRSKVARGCARVKIMPVGCPQTAGRYPPNEVSREAGAMRGASRSGVGLAINSITSRRSRWCG